MLRTLFVGVVLAHLVAVVGCYDPAVRDCTVACSSPGECTGGQVCRDGWCTMPGAASCVAKDDGEGADNDGNTVVQDAAVGTRTDAASTPNLCQLGCTNGTCVDGVCVIDCAPLDACPDDVTCPPNVPCRVICGEHACKKKVICGMATSCEVQCGGTQACADEVQCGVNRCTVSCSGVGSCARRTKCKDACACDVRCTGPMACPEPAECRAGTCKLGNGCSSLLTGCDRC